MKIIFLILSFIAFGFYSQAQNDYVNYHLEIYKARKYNYEDKLDSALLMYQHAFSLVDYIHIDNLEKAQKLAIELKNDSFQTFIKSKIDFYNVPDDKINKEYISTIDSIHIEDQRVRQGDYAQARQTLYNSNKKNSKISHQEVLKANILMNEWGKTDSTNIYILFDLIKKYGFPSEKLLKRDAYGNAFIIFLHFDSDKDNSALKPIIDKALMNGEIDPEDYAWIVDRRLSWGQGKSQFYYFMPMDADKLTPKGIIMVNERRKKIGLRNLFEGIEITKAKDSISVNKIY